MEDVVQHRSPTEEAIECPGGREKYGLRSGRGDDAECRGRGDRECEIATAEDATTAAATNATTAAAGETLQGSGSEGEIGGSAGD